MQTKEKIKPQTYPTNHCKTGIARLSSIFSAPVGQTNQVTPKKPDKKTRSRRHLSFFQLPILIEYLFLLPVSKAFYKPTVESMQLGTASLLIIKFKRQKFRKLKTMAKLRLNFVLTSSQLRLRFPE
jgi:hypothetical protein